MAPLLVRSILPALHCARRTLLLCGLAMIGSVCIADDEAANDVGNAHRAETQLLVLDIELLGDLGGPDIEAQHPARIRLASDKLRAELDRTPFYAVVDQTPALDEIERMRSVQYLHKCNGCEIDIARSLGAEQVLVAWVHRVSNLILSLTYEIRDVSSGEPVRRVAFDFRGDNDESWSRAVSYLVRDLERRMSDR